MKMFLKNNYVYLILYIFILFSLLVSYNIFFGDSIVNYGFSYAISRGEVPYLDFNLVVSLFSPWFYAIFLIFSKSSLWYFSVQALLVVLLFKLLYSLIKEKSYLLLPILFLGFPISLVTIIFPGYNFILMGLIFLLIYLEKNKKSDYIIGFILGLMILTKHTIGIFYILPSLFFVRDFKRLGKRLLGLFVPVFVFVIYLLCTGSFYSCINLCVLGLFDFASSNSNVFSYWLLVPLFLAIIYYIYAIKKNPKDIVLYYSLLSILYVIPLFDSYHLSFFLFFTFFFILYRSKFTCEHIFRYVFVFLVFEASLWTYITLSFQGGSYQFQSYPNYPLRYFSKKDVYNYQEVMDYVEKTSYDVVFFGLGTENYFYKITNNLDITYFDLPNYGNYGYHGYQMMVERFEELDSDTVILVDTSVLYGKKNKNQQYFRELASYVVQNYEYLGDVSKYGVYLKK